MHPRIKALISDSIAVKQLILQDKAMLQTVEAIVAMTVDALEKGHKILFCGNGGSAADAQHLASELSGRFYLDRAPLFAEALHVNTSALTAIGNDYGFAEVYARLVQSKGRAGDVLFALSTSGNSANIIRAVEVARDLEMKVVGMTGLTGGALKEACDYLLAIPSIDTPRIQECHIMLGHLICELVEEGMFGVEGDKKVKEG